MSNSFQSVWHRTCDSLGIVRPIADEWLDKIQTKYNSESQRIYHNFGLLQFKCDFIESLKQISISNAVVLAIAFQYYNFDVKSDCSEQNLHVFKEFVNAADLSDNVCNVMEHYFENQIRIKFIESIIL